MPFKSPNKKPTIWWIRRDVRLRDNRALHEALKQGGAVIPLFIQDPAAPDFSSPWSSDTRDGFLFAGLRTLDADLRQRGSRLFVRRGNPADVLMGVAGETEATLVCAEEDCDPHARKLYLKIARELPLRLVPGVTVHAPAAVLKPDGKPYTVFTPFSRAWKSAAAPAASDLCPAPRSVPAPPEIASIPLPGIAPPLAFPAGEREGYRRLKQFAARPIFEYAAGRDRLDCEGTSMLSPYLRFGMVSPREAASLAFMLAAGAAGDAKRGAEIWLTELIWREFYLSILLHFPRVLEEAFNPALRGIAWRRDSGLLAAWCEGRTGYPVVDAAMRQLAQIGWMHNRARMIVASFLTKDLLINWQEGERWFMRRLVDGDPASNSGGWQWTAGVGTDAAPYFRIFNPVLQSRKFDPSGHYLRKWLPELRGVPDKHVHEPWTMPPEVQLKAGCRIGKDYPGPVVDRTETRDRTLAAYRRSQAGDT